MSQKDKALEELWKKMENGEGKQTLIQFQELLTWWRYCPSQNAQDWRRAFGIPEPGAKKIVASPTPAPVPTSEPAPAPVTVAEPVVQTPTEEDMVKIYESIRRIGEEEGIHWDDKKIQEIASWDNFSHRVVREYARAKSYCQEFVREGISDPWGEARKAIKANEVPAEVIARLKQQSKPAEKAPTVKTVVPTETATKEPEKVVADKVTEPAPTAPKAKVESKKDVAAKKPATEKKISTYAGKNAERKASEYQETLKNQGGSTPYVGAKISTNLGEVYRNAGGAQLIEA